MFDNVEINFTKNINHIKQMKNIGFVGSEDAGFFAQKVNLLPGMKDEEPLQKISFCIFIVLFCIYSWKFDLGGKRRNNLEISQN